MKRLIAAIILLAVITGICITGKITINKTIENLCIRLDKCVRLYNDGGISSVGNAGAELENEWVKAEKTLSIFVNKTITEDIGISVSRARSYSELGLGDDFITECNLITVMIMHLQNDEHFPLFGIF